MPSLPAISPIGRIVAAWAICMSDCGFWCWSAPRATGCLLRLKLAGSYPVGRAACNRRARFPTHHEHNGVVATCAFAEQAIPPTRTSRRGNGSGHWLPTLVPLGTADVAAYPFRASARRLVPGPFGRGSGALPHPAAAGHAPDAAAGGAGLRDDKNLAPARRDLAEPGARRHRRRGCPLLPASRLRSGGDRGGVAALSARRRTAGRRQHDLDANREKSFSVAGAR